MKRFPRILLSLLALSVMIAPLQAQTVSPAVVEIPVGKQNAVDGHFEVANSTLEPLAVVIEAKSFTIGRDGTATFGPLSPDVHLQLSASSMRLPARQRRTVYYHVTSPAVPAWFCIYSTFSAMTPTRGMRVALEMPRPVYMLRGPRAVAKDLRVTNLTVDDGALHGTVHNGSGTLLRLTSIEVSGSHGKKEESGFPLLPGGERDFVFRVPAGSKQLRLNTAGSSLNAALP